MKEKYGKSLQTNSAYALSKLVFLSSVAVLVFAVLLLPAAKAATTTTFVRTGESIRVYPFTATLVDFNYSNSALFGIYYKGSLVKYATINGNWKWTYSGYTITIKVNRISNNMFSNLRGANVTVNVAKTQIASHAPYATYWYWYGWREVHLR